MEVVLRGRGGGENDDVFREMGCIEMCQAIIQWEKKYIISVE